MSNTFQIESKPNQSIWDVAIQYYGAVDGVFDILADNPSLTGVNHLLIAGTPLKIKKDFYYNKSVVDYFNNNGLIPATWTTFEPVLRLPELTDPDAIALYNKHTTVNGSELDVEQYSVTRPEFFAALDTLFIGLKTNLLWDKITRLFLFIGGTADQHAINAKTTNLDLEYAGTTLPNHSALGMLLDGVDQYASMGNDPTEDSTPYSIHLGVFGAITNDNLTMGSRSSTSNSTFLRSTAASISCALNGQYIGDGIVDKDLYHILTRTANNYAGVYVDGLLNDFTNSTTAHDHSTESTFIGAWSNYGSPIQMTAGSIKTAHIGVGLEAADVAILNTLIKNFNEALNR